MEKFLSTETLVIELLLIASMVAIVVRRLRIPYTVALVIVGLLITFQSPVQLDLTPQLILALFVPPLVFEAAFHLNFRDLQRNLAAILLLAVPGVVITTLIVGGIVNLGLGLSLPLALVFGSLIAATDPVSVVALFRALGIPKRLTVLIEGESLFNDGTAIVVFQLMLTFALTGSFNLFTSIVDFLRVSAGGVVIGLILGWMISRLISRVDDYLIETTLTTVLAFGSYLIAEQLHFSGVLAVVAAGLVNGNIGPQGMSPTTRIVLFNFWEYVAFLANSLIFLLIGLEVNIPALITNWQPVAWGILAVFMARFIVVYGLSWIINHVSNDPIPIRWQHMLIWGDLRGAISLALALSLPISLGANRDLLRVMAFGVVLFTLLVQSTTMRPLIRWLKIIVRTEGQVEYELRHARLASLRSGDARIDQMHKEGLLSTPSWERLKNFINQHTATLAGDMRELVLSDPNLEAEEMDTGWRELFRTQRSALFSLRRDGVISEEAFETLTAEIDARLSEGYQSLPSGGVTPTQFLEVTIPHRAAAAGKMIMELSIPRSAVLVSIRRAGDILIPRGDTRLQAGDRVIILCENDIIPFIRNLFQEAVLPPQEPEI